MVLCQYNYEMRIYGAITEITVPIIEDILISDEVG